MQPPWYHSISKRPSFVRDFATSSFPTALEHKTQLKLYTQITLRLSTGFSVQYLLSLKSVTYDKAYILTLRPTRVKVRCRAGLSQANRT